LKNEKFLICDITRTITGGEEGGEVESSPVLCLDKALTRLYDLVLVNFCSVEPRDRERLLNLCRALKHHNIPVFALLSIPHREILETLTDIGTEYSGCEKKYVKNGIAAISVREGLNSTASILAECCPYLSYVEFSNQEEMAVCGACQNRLVLGHKIQLEKCTRKEHTHCTYFLSPRSLP
jgi:hypothetical protein